MTFSSYMKSWRVARVKLWELRPINISACLSLRRGAQERKRVCDPLFMVGESCKEVLFNILNAFKQIGISPEHNLNPSYLTALIKHMQGRRGMHVNTDVAWRRVVSILSRWKMSRVGITIAEFLNVLLCDDNFQLDLPLDTVYDLMLFSNPRGVAVVKHPMFLDQMTFVRKV